MVSLVGLLILCAEVCRREDVPADSDDLTRFTCGRCGKSSAIDLRKPIPVATSYASAMARGARLRQRAAFEAGLCLSCAERKAEAERKLIELAEKRGLTALHTACALESLQYAKGNVPMALEQAVAAVAALDPLVREVAECLAADSGGRAGAMPFAETIRVAEALLK